jgi:hypothetical protein
MVKDIGFGLKSTISTVTAARTFATDPRNIVTLTGVHIGWVRAGMRKKYGRGIYPETEAEIGYYRRSWKSAQALIKDSENWDRALMLCQDIFDNCLSMAVLNDIIDYDVFEDSITDKLFGGVAVDEKNNVEQKSA